MRTFVGGNGERGNPAAPGGREVHDVQRLFNMQFARVAAGVEAVVIVDAIGEVGVFLDFAEDHAGANGVASTGGNEDGVSGGDRDGIKESFESFGLESGKEFFSCCAGFQAEQDVRAGIGGHDVPHFGFAAAASGFFVERGVSVVGMDLDGELVRGKEEFYEQRKVRYVRESSAAPIRGHLAPGFAKGFAGEWAGSDAAVDVGEPGFADGLGEIGLVGENWGERMGAPDARAEGGLDAKGFGVHWEEIIVNACRRIAGKE